ncbi:NAD(P)H-dependent FMN reductase [Kytococcus aerolatus]|uniref:NAD(P)H-dependent FMN reductase n=1 Tax=Kytococcus aerolatus TaxID=592308 RepID=A0A212U569_9MICO|nr:NAD(P)H-dependent oxidoreductase [Kytococcus aerolatus]SNC73398.1 NAD(P)H-dependent FMN reductase [Kytococcus aerolatus]
MTRIGILVTSTRSGRIGPTVARWVADQAPEGVQAEIVDLAEVELPLFDEPQSPKASPGQSPATRAWAETIESYDALVITTPEYNGSYTAVLKNAIDHLYAEWVGKPVGVIGYGWNAGADAMEVLARVADRIGMARTDGPGLRLGEHLEVDGTPTDAAPADEMSALFTALVERVDAQG